jgi:hypothetical protein
LYVDVGLWDGVVPHNRIWTLKAFLAPFYRHRQDTKPSLPTRS